MNTPDTEWEKMAEDAQNKLWNISGDTMNEKLNQQYQILQELIKEATTSRDTYWKERVRKEREEELERMKKIHAQVVAQVESNNELREAVALLLDNLK